MGREPRVLALAASNHQQSINRRLVVHAAERLQREYAPGATIELIDLNDYEMAIYSPEREQSTGVPAPAQLFFDQITSADLLIFSFAEYNGSYTSAYKNLFDWTSRIQMRIYQDKPMLMLSASIGPGGGQHVLRTAVESAPFFGGDVRGHLSVGPFDAHFDSAAGGLTSPDKQAALAEALGALVS